MPTYHSGSQEIAELIERLAVANHGALHDAGVRVDILVALPCEDDDGDLVKLHGRACYATMSITPFKLRCRGLGDALLTVDGPKWDLLSERERVALVDHELLHLELCMTKGRMGPDGSFVPPRVKRDDMDRPKLRLRPHDWEIGGFDLIVSRYGSDSLELQACRDMVRGPVRQALLPFMGDDEPSVARDEPSVRLTFADGTSTKEMPLSKFSEAAHDAARKVFTNAPGVTKRRAPKREKAAAR